MVSFLNLPPKNNSSPSVPICPRTNPNFDGAKVYSYLLALVLALDYISCQTPSSSW